MICWGEMASKDKGMAIVEEEASDVPLAMVLKDGSLLNLKLNYDVVELDKLGGEEESQLALDKGCVLVEVRRNPCLFSR